MNKVISLEELKANKKEKRYFELLEKAIMYGLPENEQQELIIKINEKESNIKILMDRAEKLTSTAEKVSEQYEKDVRELIGIINELMAE